MDPENRLDHHSYTSNDEIGTIFKTMFPDSEIAAATTCGSNKTAYITKFGLVTFLTKQHTDLIVEATCFVVMFDESLNKTRQTKTAGSSCVLLGR